MFCAKIVNKFDIALVSPAPLYYAKCASNCRACKKLFNRDSNLWNIRLVVPRKLRYFATMAIALAIEAVENRCRKNNYHAFIQAYTKWEKS